MKKSMLSKNVLLSFCFVLLLSTSCCATGVDLDPVPDSNVSSASKISIAPLNPAFIQYQEEFELNQNEISANTNTITVSSLILSDISDETPSSDLLNMIDILQYSELPENTIHSTGLIPSPVDLSHLSPVNMEELMANEEYGLSLSTVAPTGMVFYPSRYDLRDNNGVTGVRDQANAGSCWAHSGIASLESYLLHNRSQTWDFSENNVKNLLVSSNQDGFDRLHDDGGNNLLTAAYLTRWDGPVLESDDPYNDLSGVSSANVTVAKHVQEIMILPGTNHSDDLFKWVLTNYGAISVSMLFDDSYFNSDNNSYYYYDEIRGTNHAVTLVGWDDNFSRNNFTPAAPDDGAFIIKNSWGDNWGEDGYFYISYFDNATGLDIGLYGLNTKPYARNFIFTAENVSNYDHIYQYDPLGWSGCTGYNNSTAYGANVFTANSNETLEAVSFYTVDSISVYNISIYLHPENGPVNSSGPVSVQNGSISIAGYHTIDLATNVSLNSGQNFSVVVQFTTPNYNYPIAIETPISGYSSNAHAETGQSYMSPNGTEWTDIFEYNSNVCIKAFTKEEKEPEAGFVAGIRYVHVNESVDFHDASLFSPDTWEWDFGDNSTSSVQNPLHAYADPGIYNISLNVSNTIGNNITVKSSFIHVLNSTIIVNSSGTADFTSISEAIDAASSGDTILVEPGVYNENLRFTDDNITLASATGNPADVSIVSPDSYDIVIYVLADNVTITGITAADGFIGIVSSSNGCHISNCNASGNLFGLYLYNSQDTIVSNCTVSENEYGLRLLNSVNNILNDNSMENNTYNSYFDSNPNVVGTSNLVDGKSIYYLVNSSDQGINASSNAGLVHLINCSNITVQDLEIENNYYGLSLYNSNNITISNCTSVENRYGISLTGSSDNLIYNNYFNNSNNVLVSGGASNEWNTSMADASNIINGTYLGGNFWAKPDGTGWSQVHASVGNSFCEQYEITDDGNNTDRLPLTYNEEQPEEVVESSSQDDNDGIHIRVATSTVSAANIAAMDSSICYVGRDAEVQYVFTERETPVTDICFEAETNEGYVMATVNLLNEQPDSVSGSSSVRIYQNMDIVLGEGSFSSGIGEATIGFAVSKEWIMANDVDENSIRMEHFSDGIWERLPTTVAYEDEENIYFKAVTTGFSPFIICADIITEETDGEVLDDKLQGADLPVSDDISAEVSEEFQYTVEDEDNDRPLILPLFVLLGAIGIVYRMKGSKEKI